MSHKTQNDSHNQSKGLKEKYYKRKKHRPRKHGQHPADHFCPPLPVFLEIIQLVSQFLEANEEESLPTLFEEIRQKYGLDLLKLLNELSLNCGKRTSRHTWHQFTLYGLKPLQREDLLVTHNAWQKQNLLTRHSKAFALKILPKFLFAKKSHRPLMLTRYHVFKITIPAPDSSNTLATPSDDLDEEQAGLEHFESVPVDDTHSCIDKEHNFDKERNSHKDELSEVLDQVKPAVGEFLRPETDMQVYITAEYSENSSSHVAQSVLRVVDAMSPREFLTYIFEDLSLEERESLLMDEKQRRKTFLVNWPHDGNLAGDKMAQSGFYCVDSADRVQCVFCRGSLQKWSQEDVVMTEHTRSFPFCRFMKGLPCGNKEYINENMTKEDLKNVTFLTPIGTRKNRDGSIAIDCSMLGICTSKAHMIKFAIRSARMRTFARWPGRDVVDPEHLCDAGFYYTGFSDSTRCFFCSLTLKDWKSGDDAFEEHARWLPECLHLVHTKGEAYIKEVLAKTPDDKKCKSESTKVKKSMRKKDRMLTSIKQGMIDTCVKLGHDLTVVQSALDYHGGSVSCVDDLLNTIYLIEDSDVDAQAQAGHTDDMEVDSGQNVEQAKLADREILSYPYAGNCISCYNKTGLQSPASYVGLPCGHLLYCQACNEEEAKKSSDTYKHKCMFKGCAAPLNATFKTFRI